MNGTGSDWIAHHQERRCIIKKKWCIFLSNCFHSKESLHSTYVRSLEEKGFLSHESFGSTYRCHCVISEEAYRNGTLRNVVKRYFGNSYLSVVSSLIKEQGLTVTEVRKLLDEVERSHDKQWMPWNTCFIICFVHRSRWLFFTVSTDFFSAKTPSMTSIVFCWLWLSCWRCCFPYFVSILFLIGTEPHLLKIFLGRSQRFLFRIFPPWQYLNRCSGWERGRVGKWHRSSSYWGHRGAQKLLCYRKIWWKRDEWSHFDPSQKSDWLNL